MSTIKSICTTSAALALIGSAALAQDAKTGMITQIDRLNSTTRLVTLGISGNDIGFVSILENCASPTPTGHPCQDKYVVNGHDERHAHPQRRAEARAM